MRSDRMNDMKENSEAKIALRDDWKNKPMPDRHETFVLHRSFDKQEMDILRMGHIPQEMEDKWFWYMEGSTLFAHRSWTGYCIYEIGFREDDDPVVKVNRDPEQYKCTDIEKDRITLNQLLDDWTKDPYDHYGQWLNEIFDALNKEDRTERKDRSEKMSDKIVYYDETFMKKFEQLEAFLDVQEKDHRVMHRFLIDNFGYLFNVFQYYAKDIAVDGAKDLEDVSEDIKSELLRPLSYRQYEIIGRSFSIWENEKDLVISSLYDFLHDNGRIYEKKVMSSAEIGGFAMVLMNVYRVLG